EESVRRPVSYCPVECADLGPLPILALSLLLVAAHEVPTAQGTRRDGRHEIHQSEDQESEQEPGRRLLVRRGHLRKDITHLRLAIDPGQEKSLDGGEGQAVDGEIDLVRQSQGSILPEERLADRLDAG